MSKPLSERIPFAKIVTVLAISFGVGLGLCGLNWVLISRNTFEQNTGYFGGPILSVAGILELAVMALSAVGLVITVLAWIVVGSTSGLSRKDNAPQKLFDDEDKTKHDDER